MFPTHLSFAFTPSGRNIPGDYLGSLISRFTTLSRKNGCELPEPPKKPLAPEGYHTHLEAYDFRKALVSLWAAIGRINRDIDRRKPWEWLKKGDTRKLSNQLSQWLGELHAAAYRLDPFLPDTSSEIAGILSSERKIEKIHLLSVPSPFASL